MKYAFFIIFCGFSFCLYSMESNRQLADLSDFQRIQERRFHESLDLLKYAKDYGDVSAWENGKVSLESSAWGVRYVPREPGQPRKIEKHPYWPAVYAIGAIALSENNLDKAFQIVYSWRQHCATSDYKDTRQGKKVAYNMEQLCIDLLQKNNLGAWGLQAVDLLAVGKLHEVRDIIELNFNELQKVDMRLHPWYKDFFDLLAKFPFTEEQKNEQASTINFLKGASNFFYPRIVKKIDSNVVHFKNVVQHLDPLYKSNSLNDQSKPVVKAMLAESNRRLAWLSGLAPLSFSPTDFDRYIQDAADLGDDSAIYYQTVKRLPGDKPISVAQKEAAVHDLEMLAARGHKDSKIFLGKYYAGLLSIYPEGYNDNDPIFIEKARSFVCDLAMLSDPHSEADAFLIMGVTELNFSLTKVYLQAAFDRGNKHDALRNLTYAMVAEKRTEEAVALVESQPDAIKKDHYLLLAVLHLHLCKDAQTGIHFEKMKEYSFVLFHSWTSQYVSDLFLKAHTLRGQAKLQHDMIFGLFTRLQEYEQDEVFEFLYALLKSKATPDLLRKMESGFSK